MSMSMMLMSKLSVLNNFLPAPNIHRYQAEQEPVNMVTCRAAGQGRDTVQLRMNVLASARSAACGACMPGGSDVALNDVGERVAQGSSVRHAVHISEELGSR